MWLISHANSQAYYDSGNYLAKYGDTLETMRSHSHAIVEKLSGGRKVYKSYLVLYAYLKNRFQYQDSIKTMVMVRLGYGHCKNTYRKHNDFILNFSICQAPPPGRDGSTIPSLTLIHLL
jgi:hypothetical protein